MNCKCFYICNQVHEAVHECCNREELFDPKILNCNWAYAVDCGDRPLPGETTTTRKTTPTTVIYFFMIIDEMVQYINQKSQRILT